MGLISGSHKISYLLVICLIVFIVKAQSSFSASSSFQKNTEIQDKTLVLKLDKDTSLDKLIVNKGYSLEDEDTPLFLRDFMRMNMTVKSLSILKKGTTVRLPLKYFKRPEGRADASYRAAGLKGTKKKIFKKKEIETETAGIAELVLDRSRILQNIRELFQSLGDNIIIEAEGLKIFDIGEKSALSLDRTFFPSIVIQNERIIIFDYTGSLPDELKNLLEISWPEFKVVSYNKRMGLKKLFTVLLNESGYAVNNSEKFVLGGENQIEYYPDFVALRRADDFMDSDISLISFIGKNEIRTPDSLVNWLYKMGIRVVELSYHESQRLRNTTNQSSTIENNMPVNEFAENILTLLGHDFERNRTINLSHGKSFSYTLEADLSINSGRRTKVIELSGISEDEMRYAKKHGVDIFCIDPGEAKREIASKIMALLDLEFRDNPKATSLSITPTGVRYGLFLPGVYAKSRKGNLFMTDSELENNLLEGIVREKIHIVKF